MSTPIYVSAPNPNPLDLRARFALLRAERLEKELWEARRSRNPLSHRKINVIQTELDEAMVEAIRYDR